MVQDHLAAALHAAETQAWVEALGPIAQNTRRSNDLIRRIEMLLAHGAARRSGPTPRGSREVNVQLVLAAIAARDHRTRELARNFELPDLIPERLDLREARRVVAIAIDELAVELANGIAIRRIGDRGAQHDDAPTQRELAAELDRERITGIALGSDFAEVGFAALDERDEASAILPSSHRNQSSIKRCD